MQTRSSSSDLGHTLTDNIELEEQMLGPTIRRLLLLWGLTLSALGNQVERRSTRDYEVTFKLIFDPPSNYPLPKTLYGRTVQLQDGTLLATWFAHNVLVL